jgi:group I intron endonuclease
MIGIYKIINPKNKIYIGQSIDIDRRFNEYKKKIRCKNQKKLYNSLINYGVDNHTFIVIEECDVQLLNERERYWQDYYNVLTEGLNLLLTSTEDKVSETSEETKNKISEGLKRYFNSISIQNKKEIYGKSSLQRKGKPGNRKNSILTDEHRKKISESNKGHIVSDETKEKLRKLNLGRNVTWGDKISKVLKGVPNLKNKGKGNKPILQFDKENVLINEWCSITEASNTLGFSFNSISNNLIGYSKTSNGFVWKYKSKDDTNIK